MIITNTYLLWRILPVNGTANVGFHWLQVPPQPLFLDLG